MLQLRLKAELRFINPLFSSFELPDDFEIEIGKFSVEKDPVECCFLVDTRENSGLPTLHNALQSALSSTGCLITGAWRLRESFFLIKYF